MRLLAGVHELGTQGTAVGLAQRIHQLAQRHVFLGEEGVAGVENDFQIGIGEAVERRIQIRNRRPFGALQGVQIGPALADVAVGGDELLHGSAFAPHLDIGAGHHDFGTTGFGALSKGVDHRLVRHVGGVGAIDCGHVLQGVEVLAPGFGHAAGVSQVVFVQLFDVGRVAPEKIGVALIGGVDGLRLCHMR